MKVLIGYDGSPYADAAIHDLRDAGLAKDVDALVVTVGDAPESLADATDQADAAVRKLESCFPSWHVRAVAVGGRPATELIQRARAWGARLVVVGSQGRSAVGRLIFGSVSLEVAIDSTCSVRIGRGALKEDVNDAPRILVGLDGSKSSERTIKHVLKRAWPEGTELRIIAVGDVPARTKRGGMIELAQAQGLGVSAEIRQGDPATTLMTEADEWKADCIFVAAAGFGNSGDHSINGVSTELAKNANCSVEIVR